ncbi:MAG: hypothetical protein K0S27_616 [Gammaproteobacteria bacterium]|jgi:hypothetical protein|nr:hypothetical protein [Gammaproteobacteria bacterium]
MADSRLFDCMRVINKQIKIIAEVNSYLFKIEALINLGINTNFLELTKLTIYQYLSILEDFIRQAIKCNTEALDLSLTLSP